MLETSIIEKVLQKARSNGADFAEIFIEDRFSSHIALNDSRIKQAVSGRDFGIGIRTISGMSERYAYTNSPDLESLLRTAEAVAVASSPIQGKNIDLTLQKAPNIHPVITLATDVDKEKKCAVLHRIDEIARAQGDGIEQVSASLGEIIQNVWIANSEGLYVSDKRCYTRIAMSAIAQSTTEKQSAGVSPGALAGYETIEGLDIDLLAKETAQSAITMLSADYAPSGNFPVIIDNGFGGVIFHEACGHALETTAVSKNASCFCGKIGQKIANEAVTAIDDGTIPNEWGSTNIDDEGMPTQRTILIEKGVLKSYMVDRLGSLKTGYARTGSGRRAGYRFAPTSRMRNTFIASGGYKLSDLIATVDFGIYAKKMGGGSVQPETGDFNFAVTEGYIIRKGVICEPIRGATLIGNGADTLMKISMCADNFAFAPGMCGSLSGSLPTHVGQSAIKVDSITVGGRK